MLKTSINNIPQFFFFTILRNFSENLESANLALWIISVEQVDESIQTTDIANSRLVEFWYYYFG